MLKPKIGTTDRVDEKEAIEFYTTASIQASEDRDIGTRQLFERIAVDEEGHASWLGLQFTCSSV